jgi:peroxiredoxin
MANMQVARPQVQARRKKPAQGRKERNEFSDAGKEQREAHILQLPFELVFIVARFCASEESFTVIRLSRELRSMFLAAKIILYNQMFGKAN